MDDNQTIGELMEAIQQRKAELQAEFAALSQQLETLEENERLRDLLCRAIQGLKHIGTFSYEPGDDPHPLDCTLAGRVSHVFLTGMTRACDLCREFGEDPEFRNEPEPQEDEENEQVEDDTDD